MLVKAKLGEKNKFYYDEKLKRWVEEGAESPAEEAALPPPPTTAPFQNGGTDYNLRSALKKEAPSHDGIAEFPSPNPTLAENSSGIPPIPPSSNQFSARGRMGVRSRYYKCLILNFIQWTMCFSLQHSVGFLAKLIFGRFVEVNGQELE